MSLKERIYTDYIAAYKAKEDVRVSALRMVRAAITIREKEGKGQLNDQAVIGLLKSMSKQRRDAAEQYRQADREDLATREEAEIDILAAYLPAQIDDETMKKVIGEIIGEVIAETGASSMADMGRIMKEALTRLGDGADGKRVNTLVKEALQGA